MKRITVGLSTLILTLAVACGSGETGGGGASEGTYRVLFIGPLSGPAAEIAKAQVAGMRAGADVVNASGGIDGRRVTIVTRDDQLDPTKVMSILQAELSSTPPDLVVPGVVSDEGLAVLPVLTQHKILALGGLVSDAVNDTKKYPYFFSNGQGFQAPADALTNALKAAGHTKIAYVRPDTASGATALRAFQQAADGSGMTTKEVKYNPSAVDLTDILQRATAGHPNALVLDGYGTSVGYLLQARQKLRLTIPTYTDLSPCLSNPASLVPASALQGVKSACPKIFKKSGEESAAMKRFRTALEKQGPMKLPINQYSAPYDTMLLLQAVAKQAGSTDTEAMSKVLLNLPPKISSSLATYSNWKYTSDNHQVQVPVTDYAVMRPTAMKGGQYVAAP
ncbi:ABC transporter substrate-binding protein [Streptomyces mirabilis]|uniref:ABC transporter substrate-binding protein n=1 Tax=Streptomyces mirabilis TaxID=68239 RepID=UPI0036A11CC3